MKMLVLANCWGMNFPIKQMCFIPSLLDSLHFMFSLGSTMFCWNLYLCIMAVFGFEKKTCSKRIPHGSHWEQAFMTCHDSKCWFLSLFFLRFGLMSLNITLITTPNVTGYVFPCSCSKFSQHCSGILQGLASQYLTDVMPEFAAREWNNTLHNAELKSSCNPVKNPSGNV